MEREGEVKEESKLSRREFLAASIVILTGVGVAGSSLLLLSKHYRRPRSVRPERNPAFAWYVMDDSFSVRCYTTIPNEGLKVFQMNPVGGMIWQECDGTQDIEEISNKVANKFSLDPKLCLEETKHFIKLLEEHNFILVGRKVEVIRSVWEKGA